MKKESLPVAVDSKHNASNNEADLGVMKNFFLKFYYNKLNLDRKK